MAASAGDELLVLAEDDDTYTAAAQPAPAKPGTCPAWSSSAKPERLLFVGWCVQYSSNQQLCCSWMFSQFMCPGSIHASGR